MFLTEPVNITVHQNDSYQAFAIIRNDNSGELVKARLSLPLSDNKIVDNIMFHRQHPHHFRNYIDGLQGVMFHIKFDETLLDELFAIVGNQTLLIKVEFCTNNHCQTSKFAYIHVVLDNTKVITSSTTTVTDFQSSKLRTNLEVTSRCLLLHNMHCYGLVLFVLFSVLLFVS